MANNRRVEICLEAALKQHFINLGHEKNILKKHLLCRQKDFTTI
jgi:hypothetical protein